MLDITIVNIDYNELAKLYGWYVPMLMVLVGIIIYCCWDNLIFRYASILVKNTETEIDDYILKAAKTPIKYAILLAGLVFAMEVSPLRAEILITHLITFFRCSFILCMLWFVFRLADYEAKSSLLHYVIKKRNIEHSDAIANILSAIIRIITGVFGCGWICNVLGFDLSAFIASLSIGTAAIAFAAKDLFTNVFGSFVILFEEPFVEGEWIVTHDLEGVVEKITFRSVYIKKMNGEVVSVPSSMVANGAIVNKSRVDKRQIELSFYLAADTDARILDKVQSRIKQYLFNNAEVLHLTGEVQIYLSSLQAFSFEMKVTCFTGFIDYGSQAEYYNLIGMINRDIAAIFDEENVSSIKNGCTIADYLGWDDEGYVSP